jgi:hypothetical protein
MTIFLILSSGVVRSGISEAHSPKREKTFLRRGLGRLEGEALRDMEVEINRLSSGSLMLLNASLRLF